MVWLIIENHMNSNNKYLENTSLEKSKSLTRLNMANHFDSKMNFQGDVSFWLPPEVFWLFISKLQVLFFELINFPKRNNTITNTSCWRNFFSYPATALFHAILLEVKKKTKQNNQPTQKSSQHEISSSLPHCTTFSGTLTYPRTWNVLWKSFLKISFYPIFTNGTRGKDGWFARPLWPLNFWVTLSLQSLGRIRLSSWSLTCLLYLWFWHKTHYNKISWSSINESYLGKISFISLKGWVYREVKWGIFHASPFHTSCLKQGDNPACL